jgi:hypothetical protein
MGERRAVTTEMGKRYVISVRSEFSATALHTAYPAQTQAALLEGIELGLSFFGGVFAVMRFDNLRQAVARVIRIHRRVEQNRFVAFRSPWGCGCREYRPGCPSKLRPVVIIAGRAECRHAEVLRVPGVLRILGLVVARGRADSANEVELLVLRHEVSVFRR